ncbi:alpha/beta hydrolase [Actinomadura violacea]|uniref:Alpha/beta hydrolase n=1 Tax=Actinomadura violacea TaxID=2819934 RepID=A0ABS3RR86_9ACTN|nr:alpha/beta hydrolase [Actinomadura violacea]MBO2458590.1 alpha/beta hydrolase [Actinomadura violacea]
MNVHPELAGVLARMAPRADDPLADIEATRAGFKALMAPRMRPDDRTVLIEETTVPGPDGNAVPVQILRPADAGAGAAPGPLPAVLYIHGGGFSYGELDGPSPMARDVCAETGSLVVNVHYRLVPEHPFPAGFEDCYAVLCWLSANAAALGADPARIAVAGASAGGCLSAALCLAARDRGGPAIAFQTLLIPCLDDRLATPSARRITDPRFTNHAKTRAMWDAYLPAGAVSSYAAPARADDLTGLPPAYVLTCGLDPLRDEGLDYARRLSEAGVPVETKDVPGAWHLFEAYAPDTDLARRTTRHWLTALRTGLAAPPLAAPPLAAPPLGAALAS